LAAQAAARIREAFAIELDLRTFFDSPTIVRVAKQIEIRLETAITTPGAEGTTREEVEL
jgi:hypothetical protein